MEETRMRNKVMANVALGVAISIIISMIALNNGFVPQVLVIIFQIQLKRVL